MNNIETLLDEYIYVNIDSMVKEKCIEDNSYEHVMQLIREVLHAPIGLVCIDAYDVTRLFVNGGAIRPLDISVKAEKENRMNELMMEIREKTYDCHQINNVLAYFFCPEEHPLLMDELKPFSEWMETFPEKVTIAWGLTSHSRKDLRTILLIQKC